VKGLRITIEKVPVGSVTQPLCVTVDGKPARGKTVVSVTWLRVLIALPTGRVA
jgi:hypothetical protein